MRFCQYCDNMLYIKLIKNIQGDDYFEYCKYCGFKERMSKDTSVKVLENNFDDNNDLRYHLFINNYIKWDPTLPRVNNIKCVNPQCTKPKNKDNEIIYMKYDSVNMKYIYMCIFCDKFWKI